MESYHTHNHDSILGGLNLLKGDNQGRILDRGVRPPYPIIISNPTVLDSIYNLNTADLGIVLSSIPFAFITSRWVVKDCYGNEYLKRKLYKSSFAYVMTMFALVALQNSSSRLSGLVDNGLVWKRKENRLNKYDFTKDFEANSFWKCLRLRY